MNKSATSVVAKMASKCLVTHVIQGMAGFQGSAGKTIFQYTIISGWLPCNLQTSHGV